MATIIISREARTLIAKHAWSCFNRIAYGYVGGVKATISCVLPVSGFDSLDAIRGSAETPAILDAAEQLLRSFGLALIGRYASSGTAYYCDDGESDWLLGKQHRDFPVFIDYRPMCCRSCSGIQYYYYAKPVRWGGVAVSSGVRLSNAVNQRRIARSWNCALSRRDYKDGLMAVA